MDNYNRELLKAAIEYTAAETGFQPLLIEKDYFCSIILKEIFASSGTGLVFKGGTLNQLNLYSKA